MNAVDTNILIYARTVTADIRNGALLWQVACEFVAASRKLTATGYTQAQAWRELEQLRALWELVLPSENVSVRAESLTATHNLSFWDAMIVAACMEGGIKRLYTEDFDDSLSKAAGVEIINPF